MTSTPSPLAGPPAEDAADARKPASRRQEEAATLAAIAAFDYDCAAELFPTRSRKARRNPITYKRFDRAADAIRFAIEELPTDLLAGAYLQVEEERFGNDGIRRLYDSERFPLKRRAASRQ